MRPDLPTFRYRVDAANRLAWIDPWWLAFAQENGATELTEASVIGRTLWDFLADDLTKSLYREVHARIRTTGKAAVIPFRCDSPTLKRNMRLVITPLPLGQLGYESTLVSVEPIARQQILDPGVRRSSDQVTMCSCCKRCLIESHGWLEPEDVMRLAVVLQKQRVPCIRYAICPDCAGVLSESPKNGSAA